MRKTLAIEISKDLPPRARQLHPDELEAVFGGCSSDKDRCLVDSDCCGDLVCGYLVFGGGESRILQCYSS